MCGIAILCASLVPVGAHADKVRLVIDLNELPSAEFASLPELLTALDTRVVFTADTPYMGREIWASDGTPDGTYALADIRPGYRDADPRELTRVGDVVYFVATSDEGVELWSTDGTVEGTRLVADGFVGSPYAPNQLTAFDGKLYFEASIDELWTSDGTAEGTGLLAALPDHLGDFTGLGERLMFTVDAASSTGELWHTDGTTAGTVVVLEGGNFPYAPRHLTAVGDQLYFSGIDPFEDRELWRSDGTADGTGLFADLRPGTADSSRPGNMIESAGRLFFWADVDNSYSSLWVTDGGPPEELPIDGCCIVPRRLTDVNGTVYFGYDEQLWSTDGTPEGTTVVADVPNFISMQTHVSGTLYFRLTELVPRLWISQGTAETTQRVTDRVRVGSFSEPPQVAHLGDTLFFPGAGLWLGDELWSSDGTDDGTQIVKDIVPVTRGSGYQQVVNVRGTLFFETRHPLEVGGDPVDRLWRSLGTPESTVLLWTGGDHSFDTLEDLTPVGDRVYFSAYDAEYGREIWTSDGTPEGTVRVTDIDPDGSSISTITNLTAVHGRAVFRADDGIHGNGLWVTDGTAEGTQRVSDTYPGGFSSNDNPWWITPLGAGLVFSAYGGPGVGYELWHSDGTLAGTTLLKDINPGASDSGPENFVSLGDRVLFRAEDPETGRELWMTDGTPEGTQRVKDIRTGPAHANPHSLTPIGDIVYFSSQEDDHGVELWRSDGTEEGTWMVADLLPGPIGSAPANLMAVDDQLFFTATTPATGKELCVSDGTTKGTRLLDLEPGGGVGLGSLFRGAGHNGILYFRGHDDELWRSDGTLEGSYVVARLGPEHEEAQPDHLTVSCGRLYFVGFEPLVGHELWTLDEVTTCRTCGGGPGDPNGDDRVDLADWQSGYACLSGPSTPPDTPSTGCVDQCLNGFDIDIDDDIDLVDVALFQRKFTGR